MNRIILIGNGFDLAHGLKTSYANFIDWYWDEWGKRLLDSSKNCEEDKLLSFKLLKKPNVERWNQVAEYYFADFTISAHDFIGKIRNDSSICSIDNKSELFSTICKLRETKWVDIENVFYELLVRGMEQPKKLNDDLDIIRKKLIEYLSKIQDGIGNEIIKNNLKNTMFEPFRVIDISLGSIDFWKRMMETHSSYSSQEWEKIMLDYHIDENEPKYLKLKKFIGSKRRKKLADYSWNTISQTMTNLLPSLSLSPVINDLERKKKVFEEIEARSCRVPAFLFLPDSIMLLNFNYLTTADLYFNDMRDRFWVNHVHGNLSDTNSVIFGYGDELDENYKKLSEKNDNEYLRNIKSIKYLEATNYRSLLEFIESDTYQIYIMGHSCGNSDRTLLNTLFEHKNCVSIKPFYYIREDGTDNYMELIQNISRNFTDMKLMRDRVVNKTFCEAYSDARKTAS